MKSRVTFVPTGPCRRCSAARRTAKRSSTGRSDRRWGARLVARAHGLPVEASQRRVVVLVAYGPPGRVEDLAAGGGPLVLARAGGGRWCGVERGRLQPRIGDGRRRLGRGSGRRRGRRA